MNDDIVLFVCLFELGFMLFQNGVLYCCRGCCEAAAAVSSTTHNAQWGISYNLGQNHE
jgi:hypothetical protein